MRGVHVARHISSVHGLDRGDGKVIKRGWGIKREASLYLESVLRFASVVSVVDCETHVVDEDVNPSKFLNS